MNINKYYILILFMLTSMFLSSQRQHGVLSSIIDDTDDQQSIAENFMIVKNGSIYYCGDKPCEGFQADYYNKVANKVRLTGIFNKGVPVGRIKEYYENGIVKYIYHPYKSKYKYRGRKYNYCLYIEYDEWGDCIRLIDDKKEIEEKYSSDGVLVSRLSYNRKKSSVKSYIEYYPDGKKKSVINNSNRYDYDENERLRRHWMRKSEKYNKKYGILSATFYFMEYDVSGNISKTGRFYSNLFEHDQWLHITPEFPARIDFVAQQDYKEIEYNQLKIKDVYKWDYANNKTIITRYKLQGYTWIETGRRSIPRILIDND